MIHRYIVTNDASKEQAAQAVRRLHGRYVVEIKQPKASRSLAQNRLLHMWMRELSQGYAEQTGDWKSPDIWKEYVKQMFLGQDSAELNGKVITSTRSTANLPVKEFAELLNNVEMFATSELDIYLTRPDDMYWEAMGISRVNHGN